MSGENSLARGVRAILFMQMFSMLGFSIFYSTLILYTTQGLGLGDEFSTAFTGGFIACNYALQLLGGYLGGRFLSYRGLFVFGAILQTIGALIVAYPSKIALIWGSSFFLAGCGLNVVCIYCMLTQLFSPKDHRREAAFLWNYSCLNTGYFIGFTLSGIFQIHQNYVALFILAAGGGILSFFIALFQWPLLYDRVTEYSKEALPEKKKLGGLALMIVLFSVVGLGWLLQHPHLANRLILMMGGTASIAVAWLAFQEKKRAVSKKLWAFFILTCASYVFWTLSQMAPMGLTLFFQRNVDRFLLGFEIPPQWMQNINTFVIMIGGPLMANINHRLRAKGYKISVPIQFSCALGLIGVAFLLPAIGIYWAGPDGISGISWVAGCYFLSTVGELFLSPIGAAMIGNLVSVDKQAFMIGVWMLIVGVSASISALFSSRALGPVGVIDPLQTNPYFSETFIILGCAALVGGLIMFVLMRPLDRLIGEPDALKP